MAEKWTMHGKVTCDLCLEEQDIPLPIPSSRKEPYLPGWKRVEVFRHPRVPHGGGVILDLCELCRDVPNARALAIWNGATDAELREELRRARVIGNWDNVRILAPALRGGPREEADRIISRRKARDWASCAGTDALVAAVPLHAEDSHRSLAAWIELALRFCRAKDKGEEPPVTAAWLAAVCGAPHENAIVVIRSLREIKAHEDYVPRRRR
jgi:hypothetical protein